MASFYKGYDLNVDVKGIKLIKELQNPFGYNFDYSSKFETEDDDKYRKVA